MQAGDAEHCEMYAVALEPAIAQNLPLLHPGEDVLHAGTDLLMGLAVFLLPLRQFLILAPAPMRTTRPGSSVAAVGDRHGISHGLLCAGLAPGPAVVVVAGQRLADNDNQPGVGVDDHLVFVSTGSFSTARPRSGHAWGRGSRLRCARCPYGTVYAA